MIPDQIYLEQNQSMTATNKAFSSSDLENVNSGMQVIIDDYFVYVFKQERRPLNFNGYLFVLSHDD